MSNTLTQYHASAGDDHKYITLAVASTAFATRYFVQAFEDLNATRWWVAK